MRHALRTCLLALATAVLAACSDDPVAPPGGAAPHDGYDGSIELFSGRIRSIFGVDNQVCVAGDLLARFDGDTWRPLAAMPERFGVYQAWGTVNNQVYAMAGSRVYRLRSGAWDSIRIPGGTSELCPFSDGRFIAVGYPEIGNTMPVFRFNGLNFEVDSLAGDWGARVSGDRYDDTFVTGDSGFIARFDGSSWTEMSVDSMLYAYAGGAWHFGAGPLYAILRLRDFPKSDLYEVNGNQTVLRSPDSDFWPAQLRPGEDNACYVVGWTQHSNSSPTGLVYRLEGSTWTEIMSVPEPIFDAWTSHEGDVYAASERGVWRHENAGTRRILESTPPNQYLNEVWVSPEGTVFTAGSSVFRNDGGTWQDTQLNLATDNDVYALGGRSDRDFFAVGPHTIAHFYDNAWYSEGTGSNSTVYDIWVGDDYTLAATSKGPLQRVNDEWREMPIPEGISPGLRSVAGAAGVAYAVGVNGLILRLDRERQWVREESPTSTALESVVALEDGSAIAVGDDAHFFLVRDIHGWRKETTSDALRAVCAATYNGAYLIGDDGVLHFDGRNVTRIIDNFSTGRDIAVTPEGDILAADNHTVIRYRRH